MPECLELFWFQPLNICCSSQQLIDLRHSIECRSSGFGLTTLSPVIYSLVWKRKEIIREVFLRWYSPVDSATGAHTELVWTAVWINTRASAPSDEQEMLDWKRGRSMKLSLEMSWQPKRCWQFDPLRLCFLVFLAAIMCHVLCWPVKWVYFYPIIR